MYKISFPKIALALLLTIIWGLDSCKSRSDNWYFSEVGTLLWVNEGLSDQSIKLAVKETLENSSIIIAQVSWSPSDSVFYYNAAWYHSLAKDNGKSFMLNVDWLENDRSGARGDWSFENEHIRQKFKSDIIKLVAAYAPEYLTLGIEVNYYALTSPAGYKSFIKTFNELKTSLKGINPKMKIGLSFQLELLYGVHSGWDQSRTLQTLEAVVENLDYIGISTYPDLFIANTDNPFSSMNYIDSLVLSYKKPIGISETGISTTNSNDKLRSEYLLAIYQKFHKLNLKFLIWGSIIDDPRKETWGNRMGLLNSKGEPKPEFKIWKAESLKILR